MSGGKTAVPAASADERGSSPRTVTADPLTGFGTRAALLTALTGAVTPDAAAALLVVFGLAGYEEYVSLFGRLAGRSLIVKLGARLADALPAGTTCFRPREGEFAALVSTPVDGVNVVLDDAVCALRDRAATVAVTAAWGAAMLPDEAGDPVAALQLADSRLASSAPRRCRDRRVAMVRA